MATLPGNSAVMHAFLPGSTKNSTLVLSTTHFTRRLSPPPEGGRNLALIPKNKKKSSFVVFSKKRGENALQYKKLGDSDLVISEITLGTVITLNLQRN